MSNEIVEIFKKLIGKGLLGQPVYSVTENMDDDDKLEEWLYHRPRYRRLFTTSHTTHAYIGEREKHTKRNDNA